LATPIAKRGGGEAGLEVECVLALVARARAGDGAAFRTLLAPHLPVAYRIAARIAGPALAEDAVQDALAIVHAKLGRYRPEASFAGFVCAVVARRASTLARSERRRRVHEDRAPEARRADTPEEIADAKKLAAIVRGALAELPAKRREAVVLRLEAGLAYADIASTLGTSEESARVLVHLGLRRLEALIAEAGVRLPDAGRRGGG
jgi:RNA polymerase sigma-70 factor (ECF subfamily)